MSREIIFTSPDTEDVFDHEVVGPSGIILKNGMLHNPFFVHLGPHGKIETNLGDWVPFGTLTVPQVRETGQARGKGSLEINIYCMIVF